MAHLDRPIEEQAHVVFDVLEGRTDGLIALSAGGEGALARLFAEVQPEAARAYANRLQRLFPGRFYIEIVRRLEPLEEKAERSEEHTSELQSLMRNSYAVFCLKK